MTEENALYKQQMEAWFVTQQLNIDSCDIAIKHHNESIYLLNKTIEAEAKERGFKTDFLNQQKELFKKWLSENEGDK